MSDKPKMVMRPVAELYAECSYLLVSNPMVALDNCRMLADSAVVTDPSNDTVEYRCPRHRGLVKGTQRGEVRYVIPRQERES